MGAYLSNIAGFGASATYDLHSHTAHSDGTLAPRDLIERARANGVGVLAVTDHDVTDGAREAAAAAGALGLRVVPGVEVSATWQRETVHVLGLGIDLDDERLQRGLARLRDFRVWRAQEIGRRLGKKRIADAYDHARALARGAVISRTHFARFLVKHGYVATMGQAFKQYLGRGRVAHVPGEWATVEEAVGWIRGAGGIAVVAHPARYRLTASKLRRLLREFKECGGAAMEVICATQSLIETNRLTQLAIDIDLVASTGSDYHGPEKPWVDLGKLAPLPSGVEPVWSLFPAPYRAAAPEIA